MSEHLVKLQARTRLSRALLAVHCQAHSETTPFCKFTKMSSSEKNENRLSFDRIIAMSLWLHFWQTLYSQVCDNPVQSLGRPLRGTLMWEILAYLAYTMSVHISKTIAGSGCFIALRQTHYSMFTAHTLN